PWAMSAPVETTACTMPVSIILEMTLPILAMVMAPDRVRTTLQPGSSTMASETSRASPSVRPLKAVLAIPRNSPANDVTLSRSRLSRAMRPSWRPSRNCRGWCMGPPPPILPEAATTMTPMRVAELRRRFDRLYRRYDHRFVDPDPLQFVRSQRTPADREVVGLLASALAYGN